MGTAGNEHARAAGSAAPSRIASSSRAPLRAVGLNYRAHTEEASVEAPDAPAVFAKFPTSIAGAMSEVTLPEGTVDWEAERDIRLIPGSGR